MQELALLLSSSEEVASMIAGKVFAQKRVKCVIMAHALARANLYLSDHTVTVILNRNL